MKLRSWDFSAALRHTQPQLKPKYSSSLLLFSFQELPLGLSRQLISFEKPRSACVWALQLTSIQRPLYSPNGWQSALSNWPEPQAILLSFKFARFDSAFQFVPAQPSALICPGSFSSPERLKLTGILLRNELARFASAFCKSARLFVHTLLFLRACWNLSRPCKVQSLTAPACGLFSEIWRCLFFALK